MKLGTLLVAACVLSAGQAMAFGISPTCQSYFGRGIELNVPHAPDSTGQWRAKITNSQASGNVAPTSSAREEFINGAIASQLTFMNSHEDTPEMVFVQAEGVKVTVPAKESLDDITPIPLAYQPGASKQTTHYDEVPRLNVTGLGPSGILRGTLLLPVSAHNGLTNANNWAKIDKYWVDIADQNGRQIGKIVVDAPSRGPITVQEVEIKMTPGQVVQLRYARNGSAGIAGYAEGRVYEFVWDGK